ncbi:hypothetical protein MMC32_006689 [Xylographa parallela]|nr:hypothetical protein [Xylographa parallela]
MPTTLPSYLLDVTLRDFLPPRVAPFPRRLPPMTVEGRDIPTTHHLIYFPPASRLSALLPDGTDPEQSPGGPFVRRMWAGGRINFCPSDHPSLKMLGQRAFCLERISDVAIKGTTGDEKVYVTIERRVSQVATGKQWKKRSLQNAGEETVRQCLVDDAYCSIIEHRNIVFMRERNRDAAADGHKKPGKTLQPPQNPTFSHVLTPTAALLFRFSALTFNAHRIHLDKQYCQETEGHRNLLVHGPLSLVLMVELLHRHLTNLGTTVIAGRTFVRSESITEIEYRNLAPLYAEESMKVCGKQKGEGEWDLWIEGPEGGYAVKGKAKTTNKYSGLPSHRSFKLAESESNAEDSTPVPDAGESATDEPDPAPRHTLEDPEEYGKMPLAS